LSAGDQLRQGREARPGQGRPAREINLPQGQGPGQAAARAGRWAKLSRHSFRIRRGCGQGQGHCPTGTDWVPAKHGNGWSSVISSPVWLVGWYIASWHQHGIALYCNRLYSQRRGYNRIMSIIRSIVLYYCIMCNRRVVKRVCRINSRLNSRLRGMQEVDLSSREYLPSHTHTYTHTHTHTHTHTIHAHTHSRHY
jgi:hypothetical protein